MDAPQICLRQEPQLAAGVSRPQATLERPQSSGRDLKPSPQRRLLPPPAPTPRFLLPHLAPSRKPGLKPQPGLVGGLGGKPSTLPRSSSCRFVVAAPSLGWGDLTGGACLWGACVRGPKRLPAPPLQEPRTATAVGCLRKCGGLFFIGGCAWSEIGGGCGKRGGWSLSCSCPRPRPLGLFFPRAPLAGSPSPSFPGKCRLAGKPSLGRSPLLAAAPSS